MLRISTVFYSIGEVNKFGFSQAQFPGKVLGRTGGGELHGRYWAGRGWVDCPESAWVRSSVLVPKSLFRRISFKCILFYCSEILPTIHSFNLVNTFERLVPSHIHVTLFPFQIYVANSLYEKSAWENCEVGVL